MPHWPLSDNSFVNEGMKMLWLPLVLLSGAALADDALLRCRGIADASPRLACYDALPLTGGDGKAGQGETSQRNVRASPEQFGLEERTVLAGALEAIESHIPGRFEGWTPNERIRLANGQVWQVTDGSSRMYDVENPKITIRRGVLGAFYLNLEADNRSVRVRRIQ
jgi:hypothetical protein